MWFNNGGWLELTYSSWTKKSEQLVEWQKNQSGIWESRTVTRYSQILKKLTRQNKRKLMELLIGSVETQHTIGYGGRQTTEECPEAIAVMSFQVISFILSTSGQQQHHNFCCKEPWHYVLVLICTSNIPKLWKPAMNDLVDEKFSSNDWVAAPLALEFLRDLLFPSLAGEDGK